MRDASIITNVDQVMAAVERRLGPVLVAGDDMWNVLQHIERINNDDALRVDEAVFDYTDVIEKASTP